MRKFREYNMDQMLILQPDLREWLPEDHLVYFISDVTEELDLREIYDAYEGSEGGQPIRKLKTKKGKKAYSKRKETVEPVFGEIKQARGFRQFLLRGLEKVRGEWRLICLTHNLLKRFRYG